VGVLPPDRYGLPVRSLRRAIESRLSWYICAAASVLRVGSNSWPVRWYWRAEPGTNWNRPLAPDEVLWARSLKVPPVSMCAKRMKSSTGMPFCLATCSTMSRTSFLL